MADQKISQLTNYTPALDADILPIVDTANTTTKSITWANIKVTLKTYFDAIYANLVSPTFTGTVGLPSSTVLTTPVINGLATGTGIASGATASTLVTRDTNTYTSQGTAIQGYATTATAGGTTTLTVANSSYHRYWTGTQNQIIILPVTSTLTVGQDYLFVNKSTGQLTIQSSGANQIIIIPSLGSAILTCILTSGTTATSWNSVSIATDNAASNDINLKAYSALGTVIKGQTVGGSISSVSNSLSLTNNTARFTAVYLPTAQTLTGIKWFQVTQGSYTANNNNYIALYSYSAGTLTQVAISTNDGTIWKATSATIGSAAFTGTYVAQAGLYFVGTLYNESAQTTAPVLGAFPSPTSPAGQLDFTNSGTLVGTLATQNSLPTPQVSSGLTTAQTQLWFGLY